MGRELVGDFLDRVAIPGWDAYLDRAVAADQALTREAAVSLQPRCFLDAILFRFGRFGEVLVARFDVDVAGGAGADAAAGVLDVDAVIHRQFEEALARAAHERVLALAVAGEALGVFQDESHRYHRGPVLCVRVLEMHRGKGRSKATGGRAGS